MKTPNFLLTLSLLAECAYAGPRSSANYAVAAEAVDSGGCRATSATYTNDGSVGLIVGVSTVAAPAETAKQGYMAQLFDVTGLVLNSATPNVNETATLQLSAQQLLDDATLLAVPATSVTWGLLSGPITGINAGGLATAGTVFQNTTASVKGAFAGNTSSLNLTVLDSVADNFGAYAGDGVGDDWQVQFFGQPPNVNAGPLQDPDGDGQNNRFEYAAGLIPTDATSAFRVRIEKVPGQPNQKNIIISPRLSDRTYVIKAKVSLLTGTFTVLGSSSFTDNALERTVTDLSATGGTKIYTVEITKP